MSAANATRLYCDKLNRARTMFEAGNPKEAQGFCLQLISEPRCPKLYQIEAWTLHAECHPDNYWAAKDSLYKALVMCVRCESVSFTPADVLDFAVAKIVVKEMMRDRLAQYREHWKGLHREPPSEEEWCKIADAQEQGESEEMLEAVTGEDSGYPVAEQVPAWLIKGRGKLFQFAIARSVRIPLCLKTTSSLLGQHKLHRQWQEHEEQER